MLYEVITLENFRQMIDLLTTEKNAIKVYVEVAGETTPELAAASRVRAARHHLGTSNERQPEDGFLAVIFPHDHLQILPYNRVVRVITSYSIHYTKLYD